ncbi:GAF and ANTAR domain-containing protein [Actinophytocola glycyrrhizae]|uniref:GAF and ANTAR domain-containing protein n=1 Tax=Actinophytocola glycyrrhizae TaxID=2044873 RepID=A0ABV9SBF3_9PSEU
MSADRREHLRTLLSQRDTTSAMLGRICGLCVTELAVTGARVRVLSPTSTEGGLVHASDALAARLDDLVVMAGVGPSAEAFEQGRPVLVADLAANGARWPGFTADAVAAGAAAVFSFPLQVGAVRLGVLELHRDLAGSLTSAQLVDALLLADVATDVIFHDLHGTALPGLVDIRAEVHQATGMVAVDLKVSLAVALLRIRGHAFAHQRTLAEVAKDIIERRLRLDDGE